MLISFVIPCYRSENTLGHVVETIMDTVSKREGFECELVLVNDASPDGTWDVICDLNSKYDNVTGVDIAKNSGQQSAIMAGLRQAKGDLIAVSDDDGQTPVETIFEFYDCMEEGGYDVVCADYHGRGKRSLFRRMGSWANNVMTSFFMEKPEDLRLSVYFLAKRFVVEEMIRYNNAYPHMEGLLIRTTTNIGNVQVDQKERESGSSGYNFRKLFSTWVDGLTTFSIKPLRVAVFMGMIIGLIGFITMIVLILLKIFGPKMALGWTSLTASILLIGGIIMFMLGVIGEYIGRIYLSLNHNPQYVIREVLEKKEK